MTGSMLTAGFGSSAAGTGAGTASDGDLLWASVVELEGVTAAVVFTDDSDRLVSWPGLLELSGRCDDTVRDLSGERLERRSDGDGECERQLSRSPSSGRFEER